MKNQDLIVNDKISHNKQLKKGKHIMKKSKNTIKLVKDGHVNTPFAYGMQQSLNQFYYSDSMQLYNDDSLNAIPCLNDDSIDLLVTSPPYNVDLGNNKYKKNGYDLYNDNKEHSAYIEWLGSIFRSLYPKLKKGARLAINIGDGKNCRVPTHSDIIQFMTKIGYLPFANVIWQKNQVGNRRGWGSWLSPSCPSFPTPYEFILIFAKEDLKLQDKGETDLTKQEFIDWSLSLWNIRPETQMNKYGHNAMFPVEIPRRLIKMLSWVGATVLDPFNGAGTVGVACQELGRKYIGIELSEDYCHISGSRWNEFNNAA